MNKTTFIAGISVAVLLAFGLSQAEDTSIDRSFSVSAGGTLYLDSDTGRVEIESHNADTVEVEVIKKGNNAADFEVNFDHDDEDLTIKGDKDSSWGFGGFSLSVTYIIKVPEDYNLKLKTGGGSIYIEDLKGNVDAKTSGGSITLGDIDGDVEVKTSGGSIRVEEVAGNINAHTSGGSVRAKLSKQLTDDCKLTTSGGSVSVFLTPKMAVDIEASTSGGRVRSEFDVDGTVKKTKIVGTINGGGPLLKLRTSGGSVSINEL